MQTHWRRGSTLIELMVATIILLVMAIGTATGIRYSQSLTNMQRDRRLAMEKANGRLEEMRAANVASITPASNNYAVYYADHITANWRVSSVNNGETFMLSGQPHPMRTTVQYVDIDGSSNSFSCLRLHVETQYSWKTSDVVMLETLESLL